MKLCIYFFCVGLLFFAVFCATLLICHLFWPIEEAVLKPGETATAQVYFPEYVDPDDITVVLTYTCGGCDESVTGVVTRGGSLPCPCGEGELSVDWGKPVEEK